jgi:hypothetical protein
VLRLTADASVCESLAVTLALLAMTQPPQPEFKVQVPDDLAAGAYSNIVAVWHTPFEFTLDFAVMQPGEMAQDDEGNQYPVVPARVVARVKIPPSLVFQLMQALSTNERIYEERIGPIVKPGQSDDGQPLYPPDN